MPMQIPQRVDDAFFNTLKAYTVDSTYCAGELKLEDGNLKKINNHVSSFYSDKNNVTTSRDQNLQVRAAVIGCMMDHYKKGADESSVAQTILKEIYGTECQFMESKKAKGMPKMPEGWVSTCGEILSRDEVSYVLSTIDSVIAKKGGRFMAFRDDEADKTLLKDIVRDVKRIREIKRSGVNAANRTDARKLLHSVSATGFFSGSAAVLNASANYRNTSLMPSNESERKEDWTPSPDESQGGTLTPDEEITPTQMPVQKKAPVPRPGGKNVIVITENEPDDITPVELSKEKPTEKFTYFDVLGTLFETTDVGDRNEANRRIEIMNNEKRVHDMNPEKKPHNSETAFSRTFSSLPPQLGMEFTMCNSEQEKKNPSLENHRKFTKLAVKWFDQGKGDYGLLYHKNFTPRIRKSFETFGEILSAVQENLSLDDKELNEVFEDFIADKAKRHNFRYLCAMDDDALEQTEEVAIKQFKREFTSAFSKFAEAHN